MAKKTYSREFVLEHNRKWCGNLRLRYLNNVLAMFVAHIFFHMLRVPGKLISDRKHRVRITIEFLEELK